MNTILVDRPSETKQLRYLFLAGLDFGAIIMVLRNVISGKTTGAIT